MPMERVVRRRPLLAGLLMLVCGLSVAAARDLIEYGPVVFEARSDYSRVRVRERGSLRTLTFVRDSGEEVIESQVDLRRPEQLLIPYTRAMFLSYLYQPQPRRVLIVGLGGGAMVHFLRKHDPQLQVDVVEVDPVVVQAAERYFGIRGDARLRVLTQDAFEYLPATEERYDVIYMDAFLKPSAETDSTGVPLKLKTTEFYRGVRQKLTPEGVMVFNLNPHPQVGDDVASIRGAFPQTDVYRLNPAEGFVAIGTQLESLPTPRQLTTAAEGLDRRFSATFSFRNLVRARVK